MNYKKNAESSKGAALDPFYYFFLLLFGLNLKKALSYLKQIANFSKSLKFNHKKFLFNIT